MKCCVVIPARYKSSRLPGKPLLNILGKKLIIRVSEIASEAVGIENVFIATDDKRIANTVNDAGYKFIMTSESALTGTDRVAEAAQKLDYEVIVNVQGDEPLLNPVDIKKCIFLKERYPNEIINAFNFIDDDLDPKNINIPKVVLNESNNLIYISRSLIPGIKGKESFPNKYKKQVCIYGYSRKQLQSFLEFGRKSELEFTEDIEILRFLEIDQKIRMFQASDGSVAIDVEDDISIVENLIRQKEQR